MDRNINKNNSKEYFRIIQKKILKMVEKYVEKDIYVSRKNTVNYWCSKINVIITFNNGVSKSNKLVR